VKLKKIKNASVQIKQSADKVKVNISIDDKIQNIHKSLYELLTILSTEKIPPPTEFLSSFTTYLNILQKMKEKCTGECPIKMDVSLRISEGRISFTAETIDENVLQMLRAVLSSHNYTHRIEKDGTHKVSAVLSPPEFIDMIMRLSRGG